VRNACNAQFVAWEKLIAEKMIAEGAPKPMADAAATFVLGAVEGAVMFARVRRDPAPLVQTGVILNQLFKAQRRHPDG